MDKNVLITARINTLVAQGKTLEQALQEVLGVSVEGLMGAFWDKAQERSKSGK